MRRIRTLRVRAGDHRRIRRGPGVRVIEFEKNTGQSAAMYAGIMAAKGEILVTMDGDMQNDPADILRMLETLNEELISTLVARA